MQKQLLIAGSVLGALALGHQAVNADTVPTTTDTRQHNQYKQLLRCCHKLRMAS